MRSSRQLLQVENMNQAKRNPSEVTEERATEEEVPAIKRGPVPEMEATKEKIVIILGKRITMLMAVALNDRVLKLTFCLRRNN